MPSFRFWAFLPLFRQILTIFDLVRDFLVILSKVGCYFAKLLTKRYQKKINKIIKRSSTYEKYLFFFSHKIITIPTYRKASNTCYKLIQFPISFQILQHGYCIKPTYFRFSFWWGAVNNSWWGQAAFIIVSCYTLCQPVAPVFIVIVSFLELRRPCRCEDRHK